MAKQETCYEEIRQLAGKLQELEIAPSIHISSPSFDLSWLDRAEEFLSGYPRFPPAFRNFVKGVGAVQAIDVAGGIAFFSPEQIAHHLSQEYGNQLGAVDDVSTFPFAANSSGEYLLLAYDDSAVWRFGSPATNPQQVSDGFDGFLGLVVEDWRAMLDGKGAPYRAS